MLSPNESWNLLILIRFVSGSGWLNFCYCIGGFLFEWMDILLLERLLVTYFFFVSEFCSASTISVLALAICQLTWPNSRWLSERFSYLLGRLCARNFHNGFTGFNVDYGDSHAVFVDLHSIFLMSYFEIKNTVLHAALITCVGTM